jgi:hypothetical protein
VEMARLTRPLLYQALPPGTHSLQRMTELIQVSSAGRWAGSELCSPSRWAELPVKQTHKGNSHQPGQRAGLCTQTVPSLSQVPRSPEPVLMSLSTEPVVSLAPISVTSSL